ncbi:MAG: ABC transporter ATP-binding protein [Acidimicrobiia bacterium]
MATARGLASPLETRADTTTGAPAPPPFISIRGLSKSFGATTAIDDLDLDIPRGQFLVLLGPSGCGKTTTMRCIVGLEDGDAGRITVDDRVVFDAERRVNVAPNKRNMGMVFQSYALWPHKSVFGNVAFPLQMQKAKRGEIRDRTLEVLEMVGLGGFHKRSIATLSGGQMQRVALARSLVTNPTILLLDEPLSNLDAKLRVHLRHELKEIQERVGVTTVYVTHDQEEALGLADRILVLDRGVIAQDGAPEDLYQRPSSAYVADFLGMSNQFAGRIVQAGTPPLPSTAVLEGSGLEVRGADRRGGTGDAGSGDDVTICLRPESVAVHPPGSPRLMATDGANRFDGTVLSAQYQGSHIRYHVEVDGGPALFADGPVHADERVGRGEPCVVTIPADGVLLLDPRPAG